MDDKTRKECQLQVSRAKIGMLEKHPFYAHILTKLRIELVDDLPYGAPTATDGRRLLIVPSRYVLQSKAEQLSSLAHEQFHCLDGHIWRRGNRDPFWSNIAQDIAIYWLMQREGFVTLRLNEKALAAVLQTRCGGAYSLDDFQTMFWEQIYETIAPPPEQRGQGGSGKSGAKDSGKSGGKASKSDGCGDGDCGHCYDPSAGSGPEAKETQEQWGQWIREAGVYAKMAGAQAGHWSELVEAATPRVPFETRFFEHLKLGMGGDQTFDRFSRRGIARGDYLPSEIIEVMGETVGVVDSSGSQTGEDIAYALGVFRAWREQHPCRFHLVECDTEVHQWTSYDEDTALPAKFEIKGRGGTSFNEPFEKVKERNIEPSLLLYFTDGYNYGDYAAKPEYQVIWVLSGEYNREFKPPYGDVCVVQQR